MDPASQELMENPSIGDVLEGRYRLTGELGEGGIGSVYRAQHLKLGHQVAIKMLQPQYASHKLMRPRFEREAKALAQLRHPHIVSLTDYSLSAGRPYLVMEMLEGQTLGDLLRKGPLEPKIAAAVASQCLDALIYAHEGGFVHRDLKPANIFLVDLPTDPYYVKLLDFGFVKLVAESSTGQAALTQSGIAFGTPSYMSPEQATGDVSDARTDIYGFGVILFEMITGHRPFDGSLPEIVRQHLTAPVPPAWIGNTHCASPALQAVIETAMAKEKSGRYQSAAELQAALAAVPEPWIMPRPRGDEETMPAVPASRSGENSGPGRSGASRPTAVQRPVPSPPPRDIQGSDESAADSLVLTDSDVIDEASSPRIDATPALPSRAASPPARPKKKKSGSSGGLFFGLLVVVVIAGGAAWMIGLGPEDLQAIDLERLEGFVRGEGAEPVEPTEPGEGEVATTEGTAEEDELLGGFSEYPEFARYAQEVIDQSLIDRAFDMPGAEEAAATEEEIAPDAPLAADDGTTVEVPTDEEAAALAEEELAAEEEELTEEELAAEEAAEAEAADGEVVDEATAEEAATEEPAVEAPPEVEPGAVVVAEDPAEAAEAAGTDPAEAAVAEEEAAAEEEEEAEVELDLGPDPWEERAPVGLLAAAIRILDSGHALNAAGERRIVAYARQHRDDPRPHLVLARSFLLAERSAHALERYDLADRISDDARGDPQMLFDLLDLVNIEETRPAAAATVIRIYGEDAGPAIDAELEDPALTPEEQRTLRQLRERLDRPTPVAVPAPTPQRNVGPGPRRAARPAPRQITHRPTVRRHRPTVHRPRRVRVRRRVAARGHRGHVRRVRHVRHVRRGRHRPRGRHVIRRRFRRRHR